MSYHGMLVNVERRAAKGVTSAELHMSIASET